MSATARDLAAPPRSGRGRFAGLSILTLVLLIAGWAWAGPAHAEGGLPGTNGLSVHVDVNVPTPVGSVDADVSSTSGVDVAVSDSDPAVSVSTPAVDTTDEAPSATVDASVSSATVNADSTTIATTPAVDAGVSTPIGTAELDVSKGTVTATASGGQAKITTAAPSSKAQVSSPSIKAQASSPSIKAQAPSGRVTAKVQVESPKPSASPPAGEPSSLTAVSRPTVSVPVTAAASTRKRTPPVVKSVKHARAQVAPMHRPTGALVGPVAAQPIVTTGSPAGSLPALPAPAPLALPWQTPLPQQQAALSASVAAVAAPGDSHSFFPFGSFDPFGAAAGAAAFSSHGLQALPALLVFGLALAGFAVLLLLEQQRLRPSRLRFRLERPG